MEEQETNQPWKKKTFWAGLIVSVSPYIPVVGPFLTAHPDIVLSLVGMLMIGLRRFTNTPMTFTK